MTVLRPDGREGPWPSDGGEYETVLTADPDAEYWDDDDDLWSVCRLGPHILPGLAQLKVESGRKLDVKPIPGSDGGKTTDKGYEGGKVTIELVMWLKSHRDTLLRILPLIHPRKAGKKRDAYDILHPAASYHGLRSVMIHKIKGPEIGSVHGTKTLTIECVEWMPAPKSTSSSVTATPKKSFSSGETQDEERSQGYSSTGGTSSGGMSIGRGVIQPNQSMSKP